MGRLFLAAVLICLLLTPGLASTAAHADRACLYCHGDQSILLQPRGNHLLVDRTTYGATMHAQLGCHVCHDRVSASHPTDGIRPGRAHCQSCHGTVKREYAASRHARNADCTDCHDPHSVRRHEASTGRTINAQCEKCHEHGRTVKSHAGWLPQAALHMDQVPCITCHTGAKGYTISLTVEQRASREGMEFTATSAADLSKLSGGRPIRELADADRNGSLTMAELRAFNRWARKNDLRINGVLMPEGMSHRIVTLDNRWDCTACHVAGAKALQRSTLLLPSSNGLVTKLPVEAGAVLDILYGTPDFYLVGSTRSPVLDATGALIIAGGLAMPLVHGTFRFLTRRNRKEHRHGQQ